MMKNSLNLVEIEMQGEAAFLIKQPNRIDSAKLEGTKRACFKICRLLESCSNTFRLQLVAEFG